jgi:dodecin
MALHNQELPMSVAKVIEIISGSKSSFEDAVKKGISRASESVDEITAAWVKDQNVVASSSKAARSSNTA